MGTFLRVLGRGETTEDMGVRPRILGCRNTYGFVYGLEVGSALEFGPAYANSGLTTTELDAMLLRPGVRFCSKGMEIRLERVIISVARGSEKGDGEAGEISWRVP